MLRVTKIQKIMFAKTYSKLFLDFFTQKKLQNFLSLHLFDYNCQKK